jgi:C-methyltransferase C-terminal domain/Putative zinc binding domain/Methyltransferase domain
MIRQSLDPLQNAPEPPQADTKLTHGHDLPSRFPVLQAGPSRLTNCRSCAGTHLTTFLDLGVQPIANALLDEEHLHDPEPRFPLELAFCRDCGLVQVTQTIPPDVLFGHDYPYYSSFSPALLTHSREHVRAILAQRKLGPDSLVIEVASNDGYLLQNFVGAGVPVLGIDPAAGPATAAREHGIPTIQAFFGTELARELAMQGKQADIMIANNVVAHVDAINDFVAGFPLLLKDDGFARLEFAYLRDLIEKGEFDTVYHEHLFYHSITAIEPLFLRHGLYLNDAERLSIHGGSLRITVSKRPGKTERLVSMQQEEATLGMGDISYYLSFSYRVEQLRGRLVKFLQDERAKGARLAAYGAAAKGATLLNYAGLGPDIIEYVVDRNSHKVGKYMPGVKLPIRPVESLIRDRPDCVLILAWNFGAEIIEQNREYVRQGGRFILPVPEPRIA